MTEKWFLFFILLWFVGTLIMLSIQSANTEGGNTALDFSTINPVDAETLPEGFNPLVYASYIKEILLDLWSVVTWGNYDILSTGGGIAVRIILSIFSFIGIWLILDSVRRWLPF